MFGIKEERSRSFLKARQRVLIVFEIKEESLDCGRCCRSTTYTGCQTTSYTKYADQASHTYLFKNPSL
jgi:hypothetical protein